MEQMTDRLPDQWIDGQTDRGMEVWTDQHGRTDLRMDRQTDRLNDKQTYRQMDRQTDGQSDGQPDRHGQIVMEVWTNRLTH